MTEPVACRDAVARLWRYLDDDLDPADHDRIEGHLAWCLRCCGELEFARHLRGVLASGREADLPGVVRDRLERFIDTLPDGGDVPA